MTVSLPKLKGTILFIAGHPKVQGLGRTKLNKLIYFADVFHLRETGESITGSEYIKYEHGPVPSRIQKAMKALMRSGCVEEKSEDLGDDFVRYNIQPLAPYAAEVLASEELASLESVCTRLGAMTAKELSELSHEEPAYIQADLMEKMPASLMIYGRQADPDGL